MSSALEEYCKKFNVSYDEAKLVYAHMLEYTTNWDSTHNYVHIDRVIQNLIQMMKPDDKDIIDFELVLFSAILHERYDSKYEVTPQQYDALPYKYKDPLKCMRLIRIIQNVSYSKEKAGKREEFEAPDDYHLDLVSDADRLDAIGVRGIQRCQQYQEHKNPNASPEDIRRLVREHYEEKLCRLYPLFFRTNAGLEMAKKLDREMVEYMNKQ